MTGFWSYISLQTSMTKANHRPSPSVAALPLKICCGKLTVFNRRRYDEWKIVSDSSCDLTAKDISDDSVEFATVPLKIIVGDSGVR